MKLTERALPDGRTESMFDRDYRQTALNHLKETRKEFQETVDFIDKKLKSITGNLQIPKNGYDLAARLSIVKSLLKKDEDKNVYVVVSPQVNMLKDTQQRLIREIEYIDEQIAKY